MKPEQWRFIQAEDEGSVGLMQLNCELRISSVACLFEKGVVETSLHSTLAWFSIKIAFKSKLICSKNHIDVMQLWGSFLLIRNVYLNILCENIVNCTKINPSTNDLNAPKHE